jgi:hypothetical protein
MHTFRALPGRAQDGKLVTSEALRPVTINITDFWDVTPCSLVDPYSFGGTRYPYLF